MTALAGSGVRVFDAAALLSRMLAMPANYGLANPNSPACRTGGARGSPALPCVGGSPATAATGHDDMFSDPIRPNARVQEIRGARVVRMTLDRD